MLIEAEASVVQAAPAKLNLYLHVTGRRPDGYHLLDSLVAFCDVGDVVTAVAAAPGSITLEVTGPFAPAIDGAAGDNLVLRAARSLDALLGGGHGAHLILDKRLPVASGLGGGSADAAAAIRALEMLWQRRPLPSDRLALALGLGADVPVCLGRQAAFMSGIGEEVEPLAATLPPLGVVLVNPRVALATPAVFKALAGRFGPADRLDLQGGLIEGLRRRRNDLEAPAITICPPIAQVLSMIEASPEVRLARMSGSGATCLGLYPDRASAGRAAAAIRQARPEWWVEAGSLGGGRA